MSTRVRRPRIRLRNRHPRIRPNPEAVRRMLARAGDVGIHGGIDIILMGDAEIAELSGRFRGSPHPTDVLAFGCEGLGLAGEIAISLDTAARQAGLRGVPRVHELALLALHGLLHLAGLDDESYAGWCAMRKAEFETIMRMM